MKKMTVEVCVDNIESLETAIVAGADRIELCSALSVGGLTPSVGLIKYAVEKSNTPIFAMIRPRAGDFLFSEAESKMLIDEAEMILAMGVDGIVIGALKANGDIDLALIEQLVYLAQKHGKSVTFHRAFDYCADAEVALEQIIKLGCDRILTSGQAPTAELGIKRLKQLITQADSRISIMPGAGVTVNNIAQIVDMTDCVEIHLSGKTSRQSEMVFYPEGIAMGSSQDDDTNISVTSFAIIKEVTNILA
ncbi:copper homeostasis protein CutC [Vibrio sp. SS-MA-C1-2]|uniref:copper homeostasis protein CutC n=1 Tax=Vibrio sp. SS-MA-C1-2 TaxID=2908646 RepID=UPI001F25EAE0|nr:copper homeostasis protein CutC [Vibrio sp. SS-MA-C1-2]UJF17879.1 copper homeostasis protein CutC [Vibrio sp. SS-MA-C1-2]